MKLLNSLLHVNHQVFSASDPLFEVCKDIRLRSYAHSYGDTWPAAVGDVYDEQAIHFLASINGKPLATARMLLHNAQFEVEEHYPLTEFRNKGLCAEVSRLAVDPSSRDRLVFFAMFHAFYRIFMREHVRFMFCGITDNSPTATIYNSLEFIPLPIRQHSKTLDIDFTIHMLDLPEWEQGISERRPWLIKNFHQPIVGID